MNPENNKPSTSEKLTSAELEELEQKIIDWIKNNDLKSISNFNGTIPDNFSINFRTPYCLATSKEMVNVLINKKLI